MSYSTTNLKRYVITGLTIDFKSLYLVKKDEQQQKHQTVLVKCGDNFTSRTKR